MPWYELHISVPVDQADRLRETAGAPGLFKDMRVLEFNNYAPSGWVAADVMTSEKVQLSGPLAAREGIERRAGILRHNGLDPIRLKIEAEPWNLPARTQVLYYETHLQVVGAPVGDSHCLLRSEDARHRRFATLRTRDTWGKHVSVLDAAVAALLRAGTLVTGRIETEMAIYDTNPGHDRDWEQRSYNP